MCRMGACHPGAGTKEPDMNAIKTAVLLCGAIACAAIGVGADAGGRYGTHYRQSRVYIGAGPYWVGSWRYAPPPVYYYPPPYYAPYYAPYYGPYYAPYYAPYAPPVAAVPGPPVYIERREIAPPAREATQTPGQAAPAAPQRSTEVQQPAEQQQHWWYYCWNPQGYYPYVRECPGGWQRVTPQPPAK